MRMLWFTRLINYLLSMKGGAEPWAGDHGTPRAEVWTVIILHGQSTLKSKHCIESDIVLTEKVWVTNNMDFAIKAFECLSWSSSLFQAMPHILHFLTDTLTLHEAMRKHISDSASMSHLGWRAGGSNIPLWERLGWLRMTPFPQAILPDLVIVCKQVWNTLVR